MSVCQYPSGQDLSGGLPGQNLPELHAPHDNISSSRINWMDNISDVYIDIYI